MPSLSRRRPSMSHCRLASRRSQLHIPKLERIYHGRPLGVVGQCEMRTGGMAQASLCPPPS